MNHFFFLNEMHISTKDLTSCIDTAKSISHAYALASINGNGHAKRSLDLLVEVCVAACGHPIEIYKGDVDEGDRWLFGTCILAPNKATILYAHHLNSCWERFTVAKELFHVVLDKDEYRSMDIFKHIENITLSFPDDDSRPEGPVACEILAELAAMEFLFPFVERKAILDAGKLSANEVADIYKIPCLMVERYLSKDYIQKLSALS